MILDITGMTRDRMLELRKSPPPAVTIIVPDLVVNKSDDAKWISDHTMFRNAGLKNVKYVTKGRMSMAVTNYLSAIGVMVGNA